MDGRERSPERDPVRRQESLRKEHLSDVRRASLVGRIALAAWPLFAIYDVLQAEVLEEGDLGVLLLLRFLPMPAFALAAWRLTRHPNVSEREFHRIVHAIMAIVAATLALMCVATTGFESWYVAGNMLCAAGVVFAPRPFGRALVAILGAAAMHPLVMGIAVFFSPMLAAQLEEPRIQGLLVQQAFVALSLGASLAGISHVYWSLRRELFESRSIGRYKLVRFLGRGGMSEVWAAWHRGLEREVALKILEARYESEEVARGRFEREVRATASLTHPHTIRIFDFGATDDGLLYYAMELLEGENLTRFVRRRGPLPVGRAIHLARHAAHALAEAHRRGIVHRDVKPENLFVATLGGEPDYMKVLDFGIASVLGEPALSAHLTQSGQVTGTASTMSPEVIHGEPATPASDVYAMGVVLYYMLVGRLPFEGDGPRVLVAHVNEAPVRPTMYRRGIPEAVEAVVLRCLDKNPLARFADASVLARALDGLARQYPWDPAIDAPAADTEASMRADGREARLAEELPTTRRPEPRVRANV